MIATGQHRIGVRPNNNTIASPRVLVGAAILLTEIVFLNTFGTEAGLGFVLSSAAVTLALVIQLRFGIRDDSSTLADIVVFIFNWLFLDLAPKLQLLAMPQRLVNTSAVGEDLVTVTNLMCALSMVTFTTVYHLSSCKQVHAASGNNLASANPEPLSGGAIGIVAALCLIVVAVAAPRAYANSGGEVVAGTSPVTLIINRFLLFFPTAALFVIINETIRSGRKLLFSRACIIAMLFLLVLVTENSYTEKRNALGPIYIGLLLLGLPRIFASRDRRLLLLVFGMVLVFPASAIFTKNHDLSNITFNSMWDQINEHYFSVNYDSWANIYTCVEIAKLHGLQWGHQLMGSILFFVPSAWWGGKPLATGVFIGNYLIENYGMWFTNLSAPLVAEAYLDFGAIGVLVYSAILALAVVFLNRLGQRRDRWLWLPLAMYFSVFLMIIMRGSLMIALGFGVAAFLSFGVIAALLSIRSGLRHSRGAGVPMGAPPRPSL